MHADISGNPAGFILLPLPRNVIPGSAAGDVSEHHVVLPSFLLERLLELDQLRMKAQLQNSVYTVIRLRLEIFERVEIPGVDDQRLFANHIRSHAQGEAAMCIMQIVWRTNGYIVNSIFFRTPAQFFQVAVESLDLGKELDIERILVEDAHRIFRVYRSHQPVARVSN